MDYIYVSVWDEFESGGFRKCAQQQVKDDYFKHLAIVGNNKKEEENISNVEIIGVKFMNWDGNAYTDEEKL